MEEMVLWPKTCPWNIGSTGLHDSITDPSQPGLAWLGPLSGPFWYQIEVELRFNL